MIFQDKVHWLHGLFEDHETATLLSGQTSLDHMLAVERAYSTALGANTVVPDSAVQEACDAIDSFVPDWSVLKAGTATDGVVVPTLVKELRSQFPQRSHAALHTGMTSQDVVDTAWMMTLSRLGDLFGHRLNEILSQLDILISRFGNAPLMGRTRMQAALPISTEHRLRQWRAGLADGLNRLQALKSRGFALQLGGPVGDQSSLGDKVDEIALHMAKSLDLIVPEQPWHTNRNNIVDFANLLSCISAALGKIGKDIALMAQQGIEEIKISGGGSSSAMPHKHNPIQAELLVATAQFNATQMSGIHLAALHEQERSGVSWTLEWMLLPNMALATGSALNTTSALFKKVERIGAA
ncbi:3-carboxy-cis,cis-muconate cycloisomerase [Shimia sp. R9_3]|uniref:3-carboxy-cis,cis-muconate cycloisomerase n=1 Tax=Shimia sp. R9_3 TaxID=2821113 RepID=UPI001ADCAD65|nr:3-carboxy-cis,cis-muconate cycloisomerase [Shimia sp. R9_3]MBO9402464.1 3-carboxy-cis,cis-muconate cycloisomerase [Shimia sp. R9_3]